VRFESESTRAIAFASHVVPCSQVLMWLTGTLVSVRTVEYAPGLAATLLQLRQVPRAVGDGGPSNDAGRVLDAQSALIPDGEDESEDVAAVLDLIKLRAHGLAVAADVVIHGTGVGHRRGVHGGDDK
jgi:hypothetical protein